MKKNILLVLLVAALGGVLWYAWKINAEKPVKQLKILGNEGHHILPFKLMDRFGKPFTEKDIEGKVIVAEFFFCNCGSICPVMNDQMMRVDSAFRERNDFYILAHTVKPEEDSLPALNEYAEAHHASKNWIFLTGAQEEIYNTGRKSYMLDADGIPEFMHTSYFAIADRQGRIRGVYDGIKKDEVAKMITDIQILLEEK